MLGLLVASCVGETESEHSSPTSERAESISASSEQSYSGEWSTHGRGPKEQRFFESQVINVSNVSELGLDWFYEFDTDRGQEATPLMVNGLLYVTTSWSKLYAFDAATGALIWSHDPEVPPETLSIACCDAVNRGVAWDDGHVFLATLDGRLLSLEAKTGKVAWVVDTTADQPDHYSYTITGAPRVVKGNVVIGNGGAEYGARGYVSAYDAKSGEKKWRFYTVPNPTGQPDGEASDDIQKKLAASTWSDGEWIRSGGGGTVWDSMAYDPDADLLYIGVGNGSPHDWYLRSGGEGDNLFLSSIVALNPDTGEYVWHFQTTPQDSWDYTAAQQIISTELAIDGESRQVVMQAPKNGYFYVLDRHTGEFISGEPFAPVTWSKGLDPVTGRPELAENAHYRQGPAVLKPAAFGAHSWHSMSYSPDTGLVYIPVMLLQGLFMSDPGFVRRAVGFNTGLMNPDFPHDAAMIEGMRAASVGQLLAWDPVSQEARWTVEHPYYWNGGVLSTGGGLVFQGNGEGRFAAYTADKGREVWSYDTHQGITAAPMSYEIDGEQYIAMLTGYGGVGAIAGGILPNRQRLAGRLLVFKLGSDETLPKPEATRHVNDIVDVSEIQSAGDVNAGMNLYNTICTYCHGMNAATLYTSDLSRSPMLSNQQVWEAVVLQGAMKSLGMVGFEGVLTADDAEDIRAYVLSRARTASE